MSIHKPIYRNNPKTGNWDRVKGVKAFTWKQKLKIYWLMSLWTLFFLTIIIIAAINGGTEKESYLIAGQGFLIIGGFLVSMFLTMSWYRREEKKNYIF